MAKLIALSNVDHDGKRIDEGSEFDVKDEDQAKALVKSGAAEVKGSKKAEAEKPAE